MGKLRTRTIWGLLGVIIFSTMVYLGAGISKVYLHMDEAYSLALVQYDKIEIQENADFYDTWHTREYFQDYLAVQEKDLANFAPVWENQKNDVHPPLYYLLLRLAMNLVPGEFSKWPGLILNLVIAVPVTILTFLIMHELLGKRRLAEEKALGLTLIIALTVAMVSGVMYIRMYLLLTLWVLLTAWLHIKLIKSHKSVGWWLAITITALLGVLTQYYYLFFLAGAAFVAGMYYMRQKKWKKLAGYVGCLAVAGVVSLVIWPYAIQHMFFSYRGQGVVQSFLDVPKLLGNLGKYILVVDYYDFHRLLLLLVVVVAGFVSYVIYKKKWKNKWQETIEEKTVWRVVAWPTAIYFVIVAAVSPFIELRYILPVCGLILGLSLIGVGMVIGKVLSEKAQDIVMIVIGVVLVFTAPAQIGLGVMRVELLYRDRAPVMELAEKYSAVPAIYFITAANNRFLDNILPFATFKDSYLALDWPEDVGKVRAVLQDKDLTEGLVVFVSDQHDQEQRIQTVLEATGLREAEFVQVLNTCSVYYLK